MVSSAKMSSKIVFGIAPVFNCFLVFCEFEHGFDRNAHSSDDVRWLRVHPCHMPRRRSRVVLVFLVPSTQEDGSW